jgi:hypothetical protein
MFRRDSDSGIKADTLSGNSRVASSYAWSSLLLSSQPVVAFNEAGASQLYLRPGSLSAP